MVEDGPHHIPLQFAVDLPHQMLALFLVGLHRLLVDQLVELAVAVFRVVAVRVANVVLVEILVWVVEPAADETLGESEVATDQSRQPIRGFDQLDLGVDPDLF